MTWGFGEGLPGGGTTATAARAVVAASDTVTVLVSRPGKRLAGIRWRPQGANAFTEVLGLDAESYDLTGLTPGTTVQVETLEWTDTASATPDLPAIPVFIDAPSIVPTAPAPGAVITLAVGAWSAAGTPSVAHRLTVAGVDVTGAVVATTVSGRITGGSYTVPGGTADGAAIVYTVTITGTGGPAVATATATVTAVAAEPVASGVPTVSAPNTPPRVGDILTMTPPSWTYGTITNTWRNGAANLGTGTSLVLTLAHLGLAIRARSAVSWGTGLNKFVQSTVLAAVVHAPPAASGTIPVQSWVVGDAIAPVSLADYFSGEGLSFALTSGTLPAGITLAGGVLSGTPTTVTASASLTFTAQNTGGVATQSVTRAVVAASSFALTVLADQLELNANFAAGETDLRATIAQPASHAGTYTVPLNGFLLSRGGPGLAALVPPVITASATDYTARPPVLIYDVAGGKPVSAGQWYTGNVPRSGAVDVTTPRMAGDASAVVNYRVTAANRRGQIVARADYFDPLFTPARVRFPRALGAGAGRPGGLMNASLTGTNVSQRVIALRVRIEPDGGVARAAGENIWFAAGFRMGLNTSFRPTCHWGATAGTVQLSGPTALAAGQFLSIMIAARTGAGNSLCVFWLNGVEIGRTTAERTALMTNGGGILGGAGEGPTQQTFGIALDQWFWCSNSAFLDPAQYWGNFFHPDGTVKNLGVNGAVAGVLPEYYINGDASVWLSSGANSGTGGAVKAYALENTA